MTAAIRSAGRAELPRLREIERAAGKPFAEAGMDRVAYDEPPSLDELRGYLASGDVWVAGPAEPVGFLIAENVDGDLHIAQVSVHPEHAGQGIGRNLIEHAARVAASRGLPALSLTTYRDVPWNGPYYRRLGFHELTGSQITPGLRAIREHEASIGLDEWPRCCMRMLVS